jgi:hypothetical protein
MGFEATLQGLERGRVGTAAKLAQRFLNSL